MKKNEAASWIFKKRRVAKEAKKIQVKPQTIVLLSFFFLLNLQRKPTYRYILIESIFFLSILSQFRNKSTELAGFIFNYDQGLTSQSLPACYFCKDLCILRPRIYIKVSPGKSFQKQQLNVYTQIYLEIPARFNTRPQTDSVLLSQGGTWSP